MPGLVSEAGTESDYGGDRPTWGAPPDLVSASEDGTGSEVRRCRLTLSNPR